MDSSCLWKAEGETRDTVQGPDGAKLGEGHFAAEKGTSHYNLSPVGLIILQC